MILVSETVYDALVALEHKARQYVQGNGLSRAAWYELIAALEQLDKARERYRAPVESAPGDRA